MKTSPALFWCDLETTGKTDNDKILSIGVIITGSDLKPIDTYEATIYQPDSIFDLMTPYVRRMHTKTGLLDRVRNSQISLDEVEEDLMIRLTSLTRRKNTYLAGNSIHFDRKYLVRDLPMVINWLHYRLLDVSVFKILLDLWKPSFKSTVINPMEHTVIGDLETSRKCLIESLKEFKDVILPN